MKKIQLLLAVMLAVPASAYASLEIYKVPGPDLSNTVQAQTRVLELSGTPDESGCVTWNSTTNTSVLGGSGCTLGPISPTFSGGDEQPSSTTRTAGEVGIVSGSDLRIIFDANESSGDEISLDALRLIIQNPTTGALIFSADLKTPNCTIAGGVPGVTDPCTIDPTDSGNGKNDALIRLDAAQAAAFDAAVAGSGVALANVRIGLLANLSGPSSGGFEGFYVGNIATFDPPVPEPGTLAVVALGLACTFFARRRWAPARY